MEEMVVTGTRIKGLSNDGPRPVQVITRTDIDASGLVSLGDLLQNLPGQGSGLNTTFNNGGTGATNVDIRNLTASRTLVLVNGRRWVASGSGANSSVDLNTIPLSIVERIEVLKDGASAVYGTDAIAAVINIILTDDFDGAQLRLHAGGYSASGGGGDRQYTWTFGGDTDRGNFIVVVDYTDQKALSNADRPETAARPAGGGSSGTPQGRFAYSELTNFFDFGETCSNFTVREGTTGSDGSATSVATSASAANFRCWTSPADRFNYNPYNYIETPNVRKSVTAYGNYELFDGVNAEFNILYLNRTSEQLLAPTPLFYGDDPDERISATQRYNPFGVAFCEDGAVDCVRGRASSLAAENSQILAGSTSSFGSGSSAYEVYYVDGNGDGAFGYTDSDGDGVWDAGEAGTGGDQVVAVFSGGNLYDHNYLASNAKLLATQGWLGRRLLEVSNRLYQQNTHTYRVSFELEGDIGSTGWSWNTYWIWAQNQNEEATNGLVNVPRLAQALGPDSGCTGDCVPLDIFSGQGADGAYLGDGLWSGSGTIDQAMINFISFEAHDRGGNEVTNYGFDISGSIGQIGGRDIGVAFGYEQREQSGYFTPDALISGGYSSGNASQPTVGKYTSDDTYFEITLPIFDSSAVTWDVNAAVRQTDYDAFSAGDSLRLNTLVGLFDDKLRFRVTYAEGIRAPSIGDLFGGTGDSYPELNDPCDHLAENFLGTYTQGGSNITRAAAVVGGVLQDGVTPVQSTHCSAIPALWTQPNNQIRITVGSNPNLVPETSETTVWGAVWQPKDNIQLSVDFYDITITGAISNVPTQDQLDLCYRDNNQSFCQNIDRAVSGAIRDIRVGPVNSDIIETSGADVAFYWNDINVGLGTLDVAADVAYVDEYYEVNFAGVVNYYAGRVIGNARDNYTRSRATASVTWNANSSWSANARLKWFKEAQGWRNINTYSRELDAVYYIDLQATYRLPIEVVEASLTFGIENVMDEDPPFFPESFANDFDPSYRTWGSQLYSIRAVVNF